MEFSSTSISSPGVMCFHVQLNPPNTEVVTEATLAPVCAGPPRLPGLRKTTDTSTHSQSHDDKINKCFIEHVTGGVADAFSLITMCITKKKLSKKHLKRANLGQVSRKFNCMQFIYCFSYLKRNGRTFKQI